MKIKLIELTNRLIGLDSVSENSNKDIIDLLYKLFTENDFSQELISYTDSNNIEKYNLIARKGDGSGGLAFLIHSDTVPLASNEQLIPTIKENRIYGRGACDMKGPAAAAVLAAINTDALNKPVTFIISSDEEIGCKGAGFIIENSTMLRNNPPQWAITTEPTELRPIYSHKGMGAISVKAKGLAAHSSTDEGVNANFKMAPFLYSVSKLKEKFYNDKSYQNSDFDPPTNGLNMVVSDDNCPANITAPVSRCNISFRAMPEAKTEEVIGEIEREAKRAGLEYSSTLYQPLYTDPNSEIVKVAERVTGLDSGTVPYLTDAFHFKNILDPIILGPGSIKQAHKRDEYIDIDELVKGYEIYKKLIEEMCR